MAFAAGLASALLTSQPRDRRAGPRMREAHALTACADIDE
jgi:hypothetical protein